MPTSEPAPRRILCLVTDAYGGTGGIALYNRDAIAAMSEDRLVGRIVCLPRIAPNAPQTLPPKVENVVAGLGGAGRYIAALLRLLARERFDLIYCGHINLAPLARMASLIARAPWALCIYGVEAWQPPTRALSRRWAGSADAILSISRVTLERFRGWCDVDAAICSLTPNAIHREQFRMDEPDPALIERYGLAGNQVLMTLGRLDALEQAKGFDRIIAILPDLLRDVPQLVYLIVGSGTDRARLAGLAEERGVADRVIFTGFVAESDKAAHYNLADVYVMPSVLEGFGFAFLEAMACGVPVIASAVDGGREAVHDGALGQFVDPFDPAALRAAITTALATPKHVPPGLDFFDFPHFADRMQTALRGVITRARGLPPPPKAATGAGA